MKPLVAAVAVLVALAAGASVPAQTPLIDDLRARAERGEASAQYFLAVTYAAGDGVPQNDPQAVRWYRLAAQQGLARAQFDLAVMYANGRGVPQDDAEAVRWYRLAAEQGRADAQFNLGIKYDSGRGVPQDYVQAHMWYNLTASRMTGEERKIAADRRDFLARLMTPAQLAEAQRLARDWDAAHPREP